MGDQEERALPGARGPTRAARWPAGRGGWSARRAPGSSCPVAMSRASAARVRSPGDSCAGRPGHVPGAEPELGQQRAGLGHDQAGGVHEPRRSTVASSAKRRRAWSSSPTTTPGPIQRAPDTSGSRPEQRVDERGLARPVRAEDRDPLGPAHLEVDRPEPERRPRPPTTAWSSRTTTSPLRAEAARSSRSSHPSHGFSTTSSRSIALSSRAALPASFSLMAMLWALMFLSLSRGFFTAL